MLQARYAALRTLLRRSSSMRSNYNCTHKNSVLPPEQHIRNVNGNLSLPHDPLSAKITNTATVTAVPRSGIAKAMTTATTQRLSNQSDYQTRRYMVSNSNSSSNSNSKKEGTQQPHPLSKHLDPNVPVEPYDRTQYDFDPMVHMTEEQRMQDFHDAELAMFELTKGCKERDPTLPPPPPGSLAEKVQQDIKDGKINPLQIEIPNLGLKPGSLLDVLHRAVLSRQKRTGAYEFPPFMHGPIIELLMKELGGNSMEDNPNLFHALLTVFSQEAVFMALSHEQAVSILFPHAPKLGSSVRLPNQPGTFFVINRQFEDNRNNLDVPEDERELTVTITYYSEQLSRLGEGLRCRYVYDFEGMLYLCKCDYDGHRRYLLEKNKIAPGANAPPRPVMMTQGAVGAGASPAGQGQGGMQIQTTTDAQAHLTVTSSKYERVKLRENAMAAATKESYLVYRREKAKATDSDVNIPIKQSVDQAAASDSVDSSTKPTKQTSSSTVADELRMKYEDEENRILHVTESRKVEAEAQLERARQVTAREQAITEQLVKDKLNESKTRMNVQEDQTKTKNQNQNQNESASASASQPKKKPSTKQQTKSMTLRQKVLSMSSMSFGDAEADRLHKERLEDAIRISEETVGRIQRERQELARRIELGEDVASTSTTSSDIGKQQDSTSSSTRATTHDTEADPSLRPFSERPFETPMHVPLTPQQSEILDNVANAWESMMEGYRQETDQDDISLPDDPQALKQKVLKSVEMAIRKGVKSPMEHIAILQAELEREIALRKNEMNLDQIEKLNLEQERKQHEEYLNHVKNVQKEGEGLGEQDKQTTGSRGRSYREYREELGRETPPTPPISMRPLLVPGTIEDKLDLMRDAVVYDIEDEPGFPADLRQEIKDWKKAERAKNLAKRKMQ